MDDGRMNNCACGFSSSDWRYLELFDFGTGE